MENNYIERLEAGKASIDKINTNLTVAKTVRNTLAKKYSELQEELKQAGIEKNLTPEAMKEIIREKEEKLQKDMEELEKQLNTDFLKKFAAINPEELQDEEELALLNLAQPF